MAKSGDGARGVEWRGTTDRLGGANPQADGGKSPSEVTLEGLRGSLGQLQGGLSTSQKIQKAITGTFDQADGGVPRGLEVAGKALGKISQVLSYGIMLVELLESVVGAPQVGRKMLYAEGFAAAVVLRGGYGIAQRGNVTGSVLAHDSYFPSFLQGFADGIARVMRQERGPDHDPAEDAFVRLYRQLMQGERLQEPDQVVRSRWRRIRQQAGI